MICPNCKKESDGQWCIHCGFKLYSDDKSRSSIYDDDFVYPESDKEKLSPHYPHHPGATPPKAPYYPSSPKTTPAKPASYSASEDMRYSSEYDRLSKLSDDMADSGNKKTLIIICSIFGGVLVLAIIIGIVIMNLSGDSGQDNQNPDSKAASSETVSDDESVEKLKKKGLHYIKSGDYETAERMYKQIIDTNPGDGESSTLHIILLNFNRAQSAYDAKNYSDSRKYFNKIPSEYESYDVLCDDVESLDDNLIKAENTYKAFEKTGDLIEYEVYEDASKELELVEKNLLTQEDQKIYDEYQNIIKENLANDEETIYGQLSLSTAQNLIYIYCDAMVSAINHNDFSIVRPYIHSLSPLYDQQKNLISYYNENGITEEFNGVTVKSLKRIDDTSWDISVTEKETIYYSDGSSENKSYEWIYTIRYIDSTYYVTNIR